MWKRILQPGKLNLVFKYLDKEANSGLTKDSGNWSPKTLLLACGASSLFLCTPHTVHPPPQGVGQVLCLAQTVMSSQRLFSFCCHKESEDTSINKAKPHLLWGVGPVLLTKQL